jgi:hypothetical protein
LIYGAEAVTLEAKRQLAEITAEFHKAISLFQKRL